VAALAEITIILPKHRMQPGELVLRDRKGNIAFSCRCLGRSVGHASNRTRDPVHFRGDTPVGRYCTTFVSGLAKPITGIGDLWIGLDPDDFHDDQARRAELNGRRGLGIHAGRGNFMLKATHGCVRLADRDMVDLARIAGKSRFTVQIVEAA
jgi:L,D-transpeptidase catalytic domain